MWERLDREAQLAVFLAQEAARGRGDRAVTPEHLLLALIAPGASTSPPLLEALGVGPEAVEALRASLAVSPDWPGPRLLEEMLLTEECLRIIRRAWIESAVPGRERIGAEHLLLALATQEDLRAATLLQRQGVGPVRLRALLEQRRREEAVVVETDAEPPDPPNAYRIIPGGVMSAALLFYMQAIVGAVWILMGLLRGLPDFGSVTVPLFLTAAWLVVFGLGLANGLLQRRRWAWSAAAGRLVVEGAVITSLLLWTGGRPERLGSDNGFLGTLWYGVLILGVSIALFQGRSWFDIDERRGWVTLLREGGWALATTACGELPWLVVWVATRR